MANGFSREELIKAINDNSGIINDIAQSLGCSRKTVSRNISKEKLGSVLLSSKKNDSNVPKAVSSDTLIKKGNFIKAFSRKSNNISDTCKAIGIGRKTYSRWMEKDGEFSEKINQLKEAEIDWGEGQLKKLMTGITIKESKVFIVKNKPVTVEVDKNYIPCKTSIMFFLNAKARKRGYIRESVSPIGKSGISDGQASENIKNLLKSMDKIAESTKLQDGVTVSEAEKC